jgi:hypothetical protein
MVCKEFSVGVYVTGGGGRYLFHNASFPLREGGVAPQLVIDELHLDLDPALRLLALHAEYAAFSATTG